MKRWDLHIVGDAYLERERRDHDGDWTWAEDAVAQIDRFRVELAERNSALEQVLSFVARTTMAGKKVHAVVTPWPISQGLTWCGHRFDDPVVSEDEVAITPPAVTCEACIKAMGDVFSMLEEWIPRLRSGARIPDGLPGLRDQDAQCEMFCPGTPAGECGVCSGDGHYLCDECANFTSRDGESDAGEEAEE